MKNNRRRTRVRKKLAQSRSRIRLSVHRTNKHIYAQLIDDASGKTLAASSTLKMAGKDTKSQKAAKVGESIASAAKKAKVSQIKFDRGQYKYHGRVKAVAQAARDNGLEF